MTGPLRRHAIRDWVRELDRDAERAVRDAERHATTYGPCDTCKVDVGEDGIHAWSCTKVPTSRRANRGRAPTDDG